MSSAASQAEKPVARLPGWLANPLSLLSGAAITLSLAPLDLWPAGIVACAVYAWLLSTCSPGKALWRGWLFGIGLFGSGVSWVYVSIHEHGYAPVPLAVLLTALFCAGLALFHALFGWAYARFVRPLPGGMLVGFPTLWVVFEWLRGWLFTGFPWLYLGNAHLDTWIAGWAPVFGVFGLSLISALSGACLFLAWRSRQPATVVTYAVVLATLWLGGRALQPVEWVVPASERPLSVAIVQPNVPQELKWNRRWYWPILEQLEAATTPLLGRDLVVWPEAAIPNFYQRAGDFLDPLDEAAEGANTALLLGIPFLAGENGQYYNSMLSLGQGEGQYFKQRLVPFGEYVPLEQWLRGLIAFFDLPMSAFRAGPDNQPPLQAAGFRVAPFICYEVVYPDLVAANARYADFMITISNDAWFGNSLGPLQHLQIARMRALENGRYLLRGTNNGISAIIDHRGRLQAQTPQFEQVVLEGEVTPMLGLTPFGSFGSLPVIGACLASLVLMWLVYWALWREDDTAP